MERAPETGTEQFEGARGAGRARVLKAAWIFDGERRWIEGGGLLLAGTRIERLLESPAAVARAARSVPRVEDLGEWLLTPGLVVAHAHLELSALAGAVPRGPDLTSWIASLVAQRGAIARPEMLRARGRALDQLLTSGATTIADVDSMDLSAPLDPRGPRVLVQREVLDLSDPARRAAAIERVRRRLRTNVRRFEGISPHAPYTVSDELFQAVAAVARQRNIPVAVHFHETPEEREWSELGTGPFERLVGPNRNRGPALDRLDRAGLLGPATSLVHANDITVAERRRIAASGAAVVHCPGAHEFFGRPTFPLADWLEAGVPLGLGTDSAAGNQTLDAQREVVLARAAAKDVAPERLLAIATWGSARAIGLGERLGRLVPGALADLAAWEVEGAGPAELSDSFAAARRQPRGVWVGGRQVRGDPAPRR